MSENPRFIQIHTLTSYPASLLNRDDVGLSKRITFGGVTRTRVSSQCLKRHWRRFDGAHALGALGANDPTLRLSVRSRQTFEKCVIEPLEREGLAPALVRAAVAALAVELLGESAKAKKAKEEEDGGGGKKKAKKKEEGGAPATAAPTHEPLETNQVTVLGWPEIEFVRKLAREIVKATGDGDAKAVGAKAKEVLGKDQRENLRTMRRGAGLDAAIFGRMVTSDILARCDAALHVAHAFTVHEQTPEDDYFSAVDDILAEQGELGSGHINTAELTTGLFYSYVVVDVPLLVSNLEGTERKAWLSADRGLAATVVEHFVHLMATVSPGAKLGSTAPHAAAHMVLVEAGSSQPRTLANAFLAPVNPARDLLVSTYRALAEHVKDVDDMYGKSTERHVAALGRKEELAPIGGEFGTLDEVAAWCAKAIRGGAA